MTTSVTAAVLFVGGRLLICQRPIGDSLAGLWELPGGKIEANETPEECLARELTEELGITTEIGPLFGVSRHNYDRGVIELLAYRAFWRSGKFEAHVHADFQFASFDELARVDFAPADIPLIERLRKEWRSHAVD